MAHHTAKKLGRRGSKHQTRTIRRKDSFLRFPLHKVALLQIDKTGVSTSKRVYFRMFLPSLASFMAARPYFCSFLLFVVEVPANFVEQRKEQSHAQCHVTHRIRIFDKISEHAKVAKSVDIAVPELAVTSLPGLYA